MRKIIQIAAISEGDSTHSAVVALCDDGSIHCLGMKEDTWNELPPIPQKLVERSFIGQQKD